MHNNPAEEHTMHNNKESQKNSNRRKLVMVLVVFVLPVVAAVSMYLTGWKPSSTGNYGELVQPARFIDDREMQTVDGKTVKFSELHGKWTMVYFDSASCTEECVKQLYVMRQTHIAQGKDQDRVQRVFILTDDKSPEDKVIDTLVAKLSDYAGMRVWKGDKIVLAKLTQEFGMGSQEVTTSRAIYLLDPQGNLMMRYVAGIDPAGMRKDLVRLLKYSSEK